MKKYTLLPEHKARFAEWRDKWIANAMSTKPMDSDERATVRRAIIGMYRAAGLEPPPDHRIVFVPSPFVARFATGFASWIWHKRSDAATYAATVDATVDATRAATDAATVDATYAATDAALDDATDAATRATGDREARWFRLGGCSIAMMGRLAEEIFPRHQRAMLECAYKAWRMMNGGNQWPGWIAYLSFFRHVAGLTLDYDKWDHYEKLAEHSGPRFMHEKFCIVSDRPEVLLVDEQNRPHCTTGPFCRWRDGSALYAVHGVRLPWKVVEHRDRLTVAQIDAEQNAEIRRVMLELYGEARYLQDSGAQPIHSDKYGVLFRKEIPDDEPLIMVRVVNSTPEGHWEDDGIGELSFVPATIIGQKRRFVPDLDTAGKPIYKTYYLRVPPTMETAHQAVAWTFGKEAKDYRPDVET